jgi:hypothetical protein
MLHVNPLTKLCAVLIACFGLAATSGCQSETTASPSKREAAAAGVDKPSDVPKDSEQSAAADPFSSDRDNQIAAIEDEPAQSDAPDDAPDQPKFAFESFPVPEHFVRLQPDQNVWVDKKNRTVVMDGEICLREGLLELLLCEEGGKTHESVIKVKAKPSIVRAGLEAIGAKKGKPAEFQPEYKPATGDEIEIRVKYLDPKGKLHEVMAQEFVRNVKTGKALDHPWVFAGSFFSFDEFEKKEVFMADATGDFICVSNFPTAIMDLPIPSSQTNEQLMFDAFKENIPLVGTKVRVTLKPKPMKKTEGEAAPEKS